MIEVGQEVTVINDKGVAYNGIVTATATSDDGHKAFKISIDGAGLQQLGQWHKASEVFLLDPQPSSKLDEQMQMKSFLRH